MFAHLMDHLGPQKVPWGAAQTTDVRRQSFEASSPDGRAAESNEYKQIYLDFTAGNRKGIYYHSMKFVTFWGNPDTKKEQKFWADMTEAVLGMLTSWFNQGWRLDGVFTQAVSYRYEHDNGLLGGDTYVGASVRLRRLAR